jgi:indolepyruvate ferredoxin oxidoreductase beta subunit
MSKGNGSVREDAVNIFIVGVGGQGVIAAGEIACAAALHAGLEAKKSEVHGMSQRGGVVTSHVRVGRNITSPLISDGEADVLLAFELAEALRWMHFVRPGGVVIVNDQKIVPPIAFTLGLKYPDKNALDKLEGRGIRLISLDAFTRATELGDQRLVNSILTGVLAALPEMKLIPRDSWTGAIQARFANKMENENLNAFMKGHNYLQS